MDEEAEVGFQQKLGPCCMVLIAQPDWEGPELGSAGLEHELRQTPEREGTHLHRAALTKNFQEEGGPWNRLELELLLKAHC